MKNTSNVIAIYSRKSKFTGKGESIGNQVELCREYIRTHYGDEAADKAVVFEDEGFSGGNINRPAFKKMMTHIERGEFKALVVYRLDRVSRNVSDFLLKTSTAEILSLCLSVSSLIRQHRWAEQ